jgi:O-antigen ligase
MFIAIGVLLIYSLLSFGGVLPHNALAMSIVLAAAIVLLVAIRCFRGETLDVRVVIVLSAASAMSLWVSPRIGVPAFVGAWAFSVARDSTERHLMRFLHFLLFVGVAEALLGLYQYFVAPGWIFGYVNFGSAVSGSLINRNHFAGLLEMLVPVSFGLAYIAARGYGGVVRSYVYLMLGALTALALIFSMSRMGIISVFFTVGFMVTIVRIRSSQRRMATVMGFGLVCLILSGALWVGVDAIVVRYGALLESEAAFREGRMLIYRDTLDMIADNPWGVGVDGYRDVFRQYQTFQPGLLIDHAHNDYLETAVEWGIPLATVFWAFVLTVLVQSVRAFLRTESLEYRGVLLASCGAIFSILVHSLADFNLQIPSNAMLFCIFVGIALACSTRRIERML